MLTAARRSGLGFHRQRVRLRSPVQDGQASGVSPVHQNPEPQAPRTGRARELPIGRSRQGGSAVFLYMYSNQPPTVLACTQVRKKPSDFDRCVTATACRAPARAGPPPLPTSSQPARPLAPACCRFSRPCPAEREQDARPEPGQPCARVGRRRIRYGKQPSPHQPPDRGCAACPCHPTLPAPAIDHHAPLLPVTGEECPATRTARYGAGGLGSGPLAHRCLLGHPRLSRYPRMRLPLPVLSSITPPPRVCRQRRVI